MKTKKILKKVIDPIIESINMITKDKKEIERKFFFFFENPYKCW